MKMGGKKGKKKKKKKYVHRFIFLNRTSTSNRSTSLWNEVPQREVIHHIFYLFELLKENNNRKYLPDTI